MVSIVHPGFARRVLRRISAEAAIGLDTLAPLVAARTPHTPALYYGWRQGLGLASPSRGGFVKLQQMQKRYPNSPRAHNLLYLVSSALPERADLLVRAASVRRIPLVWNQNGVAYPGWHGPGFEAVNLRLSRLMRQAAHVFYQSGFCRLAADKFLEPAEAAEVLPNPVDTLRFAPAAMTVRPEPLVLLAGGTCYQRYRFEVAAETLRCLLDAGLDAWLHFAGRPAWAAGAREEADQIAARLEVSERLEFVPPYTQLEAPAVLRAAHVLLHTKYNDNCPTLVLEAMACGLPVAYSASGGTPELVGPDAGIGIPAPLDWEEPHPPAPELLADAIRRIVAEYPRRSIAARLRAEQFDLVPWLARHQQVFERLVGAT